MTAVTASPWLMFYRAAESECERINVRRLQPECPQPIMCHPLPSAAILCHPCQIFICRALNAATHRSNARYNEGEYFSQVHHHPPARYCVDMRRTGGQRRVSYCIHREHIHCSIEEVFQNVHHQLAFLAKMRERTLH